MTTSVIIITYNQSKYILESLQSIENQTELPDELIIADDCSIDNTNLIIKEFIKSSKIKTIKYFSNPRNLGIVGNINNALNSAQMDIIILQAGDDVSVKTRIKETKNFFEHNEKIPMILSSYNIIDEFGFYRKTVHRKGFYQNKISLIKKGSALAPFGMAFKLKMFNKFFPIPIVLKNEDDYLGFLGVICGGIYIVKEPMYNFRVNCGVSSWMYSKSIPKEDLIFKYRNDIGNRIANFQYWEKILCENDIEEKRLINRRIEVVKIINQLEEFSILRRIWIFFEFINITSVREKMIIGFGFNSLFILGKIKRFLIGI